MNKKVKEIISPLRKLVYRAGSRRAWSYGYNDVRWELIEKTISSEENLKQFAAQKIQPGFGIGFDERVAEYPWIFSRLGKQEGTLLDAGSTFNFKAVLDNPLLKNKQLYIYTYYPEPDNFVASRISYVFGDLRNLPFSDHYFDQLVCQSTIEHIDMDNSIYGYDLNRKDDVQEKSYEYMKVVSELIRVLKKGGKLLLTFPYGKFENHGFFQQFDAEMVNRILNAMKPEGESSTDYLLYTTKGWTFASAEECKNSESYNPHTGKGKGDDGAAHCRAICCIEFTKNK